MIVLMLRPDHHWDRFQHHPQPLHLKMTEKGPVFSRRRFFFFFFSHYALRQASGTLSSSYLSHHRKQNFSISLSISSVITVAFDGLLTTEASLLWDSARASIGHAEWRSGHRLPPPISGPCHRRWTLCWTTSGTSCSLAAPVDCRRADWPMTWLCGNLCQIWGQIWGKRRLSHALNIKLPWAVTVSDNINESRLFF